MYNEWKIIERYPDYEINEMARIRNIKTGKEVVTSYNSTLGAVLRDEYGKNHSVRVAPLLAEAFHGYPGDGYEVAYHDNNRFNCTAENVYWCLKNKKERHIPQDEIFRNSRIRVVETGKIYSSVYAYSDITGEDISVVKRCIKDPSKRTSQGYHLEIYDYSPYLYMEGRYNV